MGQDHYFSVASVEGGEEEEEEVDDGVEYDAEEE